MRRLHFIYNDSEEAESQFLIFSTISLDAQPCFHNGPVIVVRAHINLIKLPFISFDFGFGVL